MNRVDGPLADGTAAFAGGGLPLADGHDGEVAMFRPEDLRLVDEGAAVPGTRGQQLLPGRPHATVIDAGGDSMLVARVQQRETLHAGDGVHCAVDAGAVADCGRSTTEGMP